MLLGASAFLGLCGLLNSIEQRLQNQPGNLAWFAVCGDFCVIEYSIEDEHGSSMKS